jgi:hypothetical protein
MWNSLERSRLCEQLIFSHVLFVNDDGTDNSRSQIRVMFFQFGQQIVHRAASSGRATKNKNLFCTAQRLCYCFVEGFEFRLALIAGILFHVCDRAERRSQL